MSTPIQAGSTDQRLTAVAVVVADGVQTALKTDLVAADITLLKVIRKGGGSVTIYDSSVPTGSVNDHSAEDDAHSDGYIWVPGSDGVIIVDVPDAGVASGVPEVWLYGEWTDGSDSGTITGDACPLVGYDWQSDVASILVDTGTTLPASINAIDLNVTVAPLQATAPQRVNGTTITYFVGEVTSQTIAITDANDAAVDLSGITPQVVIESRQNRADIQTVTPSVSGASSNQITFTNNASVTKTVRELRWSLRDTSDSKVYAHGIVDVKYATGADS